MILKEEYKSIRQREKGMDNKTAYKVTVRQLESLIRLSEAMARAHCDNLIRPTYVKEVCRLLRNSNINISKKISSSKPTKMKSTKTSREKESCSNRW